jgi:hypothetical protein
MALRHPDIRRRLAPGLLAIVLALAMPEPATAQPAPEAVTGQFAQARLAGEGELRWFGLKVYAAQLWVGPQAFRPERSASLPFALQLQYATGLKGELIAERSLQEIERMGFGDPQRRGRWFADMKRLFPNVARGDRLTGVNEPGRGARFYHNDRPIGAVDDPDFATAFFAIWLDERTVAPSLRDALLKQASAGAGAPR